MQMMEETSFLSSNGKDTVYCRIYAPDVKPRAVVQIAHGMAEHIGRYDELAKCLAESGVIVCGNDHLGHGRTVSAIEDLGYLGDKNSWTHMVDDLHILRKMMRQKYGDLPYFLLGHSMGSLLLRAYLSCYGNEIQGSLLIGTSGYNKSAKAAMPLVDLIEKIKGPKHRSRLVYSLAFGGYNKRYEKGCRKLAWMSQDNQVLDSFRNDPRCNFVLTVSAFRDLLKLLTYVSRKDWALEVPVNLPVILLSGDMDPVGDFGNGTREVFKQLQMAGVKDLSLKLYPGLRHEILNEPGKERVRKDILNWIFHICEAS